MSRTTIDFGIDLGTTNSTISVVDGIDAKTINNNAGSALTPSAVWIDRRGHLRVGQESKLRALVDDPKNADLEFKLRMGMGAGDGKHFERSNRTLSPEELSAEVLKSLRADVRTAMGEDIESAVITVPAAFEQSQTAATIRAARLAGLNLTPLLLEPVAASLAYGLQSVPDNVFWLVYDFGGGTFDAAVMRIRDGMIHVENHEGDNFLGGKLIDWDIVTERLIPAAQSQHRLTGLKRGDDRWAEPLGKLKFHAEHAKIEVCRSRAPSEIYIEQWCCDESGKEIDFLYTLTPEDIATLSAPYVARSLNLCSKTLQGAKLPGSAIERVLMVGGSTLNPWIREGVEAELKVPLEFSVDPVTIVARGAAIFASTVANGRAGDGKGDVQVPAGTWEIQLEYPIAGNVPDPDIGGRITAPERMSCAGCTIEFIDQTTRWRSGKIALGVEGVFTTQFFAETEGRHEFRIELCDPRGTPLPVSRQSAPYTYRKVIFDKPPAVHTIQVGLSSGKTAVYVEKGQLLPARRMLDHIAMVGLRAGHAEDVLRIPLLEGEDKRAARNHRIGEMRITGAQVPRDLPMGSQVEITVVMNESQQIKLEVFVPMLELDFEQRFDDLFKPATVDDAVQEADLQQGRLAKARAEAIRIHAAGADIVIMKIEKEKLLEQIIRLCAAARGDKDALGQLDRLLKELAALVDQLEDAVEWPKLVEEARKARKDAEEQATESGTEDDKRRLRTLVAEFERAMATEDGELLRRNMVEFDILYFDIVDRKPGIHVGRFNYYAGRKDEMTDRNLAEQVIAQGRRAINNNDLDGVKAANRQLRSLLPRIEVEVERNPNDGDTETARR
jgi:molecular chaperone DnaK